MKKKLDQHERTIQEAVSMAENVRIMQSNISKEFVKFGAGIAQNRKGLDNLAPFCYQLKQDKADKADVDRKQKLFEKQLLDIQHHIDQNRQE